MTVALLIFSSACLIIGIAFLLRATRAIDGEFHWPDLGGDR